jgi:hypothetical protein
MDEREWHAHLDSAVSTDVRDEGDTTAEAEHSSLAALSFGEGATTSVDDMIGFHTPDEPAPSVPSVEPEEILAEFDGLAARLTAGAETMSELRNGVERLFETSAETSRELEAQRRLLEAGEDARQQDRDTIAQLEEQVGLRTQAVADMKRRLGDLMRDIETIV